MAEKLVNRVVFDELEGRGLRPLATPKVTDLKIDENQPLTFRAVFETLPLVELPEYKGLPVEGARSRGSTTRTWTRRSTACARRPRATTRSRAGRPREGDFVVLDVQFTKDGRHPRQADENVLVEVGSDGQPQGPQRGPRRHVARRDRRTSRSSTARTTRSERLRGKTVDYTSP